MAQQVQVLLTDDLDGGEATQTITFGLDGNSFEIDLSDANAKQLRDTFAPFTDHARKAGTNAPAKSRRTAEGRARAGDIRAWAKDQGYKISDRGRIPPAIVRDYEQAHA